MAFVQGTNARRLALTLAVDGPPMEGSRSMKTILATLVRALTSDSGRYLTYWSVIIACGVTVLGFWAGFSRDGLTSSYSEVMLWSLTSVIIGIICGLAFYAWAGYLRRQTTSLRKHTADKSRNGDDQDAIGNG